MDNPIVIKPAPTRLPAYVRLSEEEFKQIAEHHQKTGESIPQILKDSYFSKPKLQILMPEMQQRGVISELKRIGNNVNQIAKHLNSGLRTGWHKEFSDVIAQLQNIERIMGGAYGNR